MQLLHPKGRFVQAIFDASFVTLFNATFVEIGNWRRFIMAISLRFGCDMCCNWMLLKPGTGNREPGTGNGEQESGNERSAVFHLKIQNGGRENSPVEKRTTQVAKSTANLS